MLEPETEPMMEKKTREAARGGLWRRALLKVQSIALVTVVLQVLMVAFVPRYTTTANIQLLLRSIPTLGVVALGVCLLMIAQEFDLSVGSIFALAPLLAALMLKAGLNVWLTLIVSLIAGALVGIINGLVTVKTKIPSFITTLGTMMAWRGVVLVISDGKPISFFPSETYKALFNGTISIIPAQFLWFLGLTTLFWLLLDKHSFGNHVIATGGNSRVARAMGIDTDKVKVICFAIAGIMAAFAGNFDAARISTVFPVQGEGLALTAIAAVVIGGTNLRGGEGTVWGTFLGAAIVYTIQDVLLLLRVRAYYFDLFVGIVIVAAVVMNVTIGERRNS
jgi:simple sugar transport system permease protein